MRPRPLGSSLSHAFLAILISLPFCLPVSFLFLFCWMDDVIASGSMSANFEKPLSICQVCCLDCKSSFSICAHLLAFVLHPCSCVLFLCSRPVCVTVTSAACSWAELEDHCLSNYSFLRDKILATQDVNDVMDDFQAVPQDIAQSVNGIRTALGEAKDIILADPFQVG